MKLTVKTCGIVAAAALAVLLVPDLAHAANAGGGGMPYSTGFNTYRTSVTTEVAAIICVICVVGGVATYLLQSHFEALMQKIAQTIMGICIIGGAVAFMTAVGVTGAVIP
jgi:type IV secretory pathway VirB2 component (pilin)